MSQIEKNQRKPIEVNLENPYMAESRTDASSNSVSGKNVNVLERAKEEFEAYLHSEKRGNQHHKETRGLGDDTSMSDVKAPNVFERAKEEFEALVGVLHSEKESKRRSAAKDWLKREEVHSERNDKAPNLSVEIESLRHKPHHHRETHGMSDDIDENTPISEVKGPNVFERAKEEIEALIQTIHTKKDSGNPVNRD